MGKAVKRYPKNKNKLLAKPFIVGHEIKYEYDSKDRRISKTITSSPLTGEDTGGGDTTVHSYKYDNWSVMEENITRRHSERSEESQEGDPSASPQDDEEVKYDTHTETTTPHRPSPWAIQHTIT